MNARKREHGDAHRPSGSGDATSGAEFDPTSLQDDAAVEGEHGTPRAAPAPQSPLTDDELDRLKSQAVTSPLPLTQHGQPDPASKKKGG